MKIKCRRISSFDTFAEETGHFLRDKYEPSIFDVNGVFECKIAMYLNIYVVINSFRTNFIAYRNTVNISSLHENFYMNSQSDFRSQMAQFFLPNQIMRFFETNLITFPLVVDFLLISFSPNFLKRMMVSAVQFSKGTWD